MLLMKTSLVPGESDDFSQLLLKLIMAARKASTVNDLIPDLNIVFMDLNINTLKSGIYLSVHNNTSFHRGMYCAMVCESSGIIKLPDETTSIFHRSAVE